MGDPAKVVEAPSPLTQRHRLLATLHASGLSVKEAAARVGISYPTALVVTRSPLYQALLKVEADEFLERVRQQRVAEYDAGDAIADRAKEIVDRQFELASQSKRLAVAARANEALLDRVAPKRERVEEHRELHLRVTVEQRDRILTAMREAGVAVARPALTSIDEAAARPDGDPIDVEVVEDDEPTDG